MAIVTARMKRVLGARVRELRKQRNWLQRDLAAACGLAASQVGRLERGQSNATTTTLLKIADRFDITLTELFRGVK
ncbi:MAG TPA: helix-turn-helix transcriptional regulator [Candidatus Saccharimonadales bacterium]|jgi:transcriptional regulator with XRE-family HTH domain|nr:helix-turn-helix transcriptional regulator [Candidatus Saccharimonadales bacterium]